jgi:hypothetical protein
VSGKVPPGKRVLNTHIAIAEHALLKEWAARDSDTITAVLRRLIREEDRRRRCAG